MKERFVAALSGAPRRLWYLLIAALCVAVDQWSKWWATTDLRPIGDYPLLENVFHLTYVENRGAAFGMLSDARWVFMILSAAAIAVICGILLFWPKMHPLMGIALALAGGGGIGNMIDRVANGYVVDFFNVTCIDFAVFNVADTFVCVGVGLLVLYMILFEFRTDRKKTNGSEEGHD